MLTGRSAALLFLVFIPGSVVWFSSLQGHDFARVAQVLLGATCTACVAMRLVRDARPFATRAVAGITLIAALALISILAAPDVAMAAREGALFLGLACVVAVVASSHPDDHSDNVLAAAVSVAAALYGALVLMALFINLAHGAALERFGLFVGYNNHRFFNHVQTAMLPLLAIAAGRTFKRRVFTRLAWFGLTTGFALLAFSAGRGTILGLLVGTVVSLLLFRCVAWPVVRRLSVGATMGGVLYVFLFVVLPRLTGSTVELTDVQSVSDTGSTHARIFLWRLALADAAESPWLGIGPMQYAHRVNVEAAHPHNAYLQVAAEWGLPMLILLLAASGWGLWRLARTVKACTDRDQVATGVGLFIAAIAIAVDAVFSGNFVMPVSQVWIALVIGWAMAWTRRNSRLSSAGSNRCLPRSLAVGIGIGVAASLLASQLWLCWSAWPELRRLDAHLDHVQKSLATGDHRNPRFWSDGWF